MSMRSCSNSCTVVQGMLVPIQGTLFLLITSMILSVAAIHSKNLDDKEQCILWHMDPKISHNASNIWNEFLPCDGTHLYHLFNKSLGIDVTICPEQNLHNWLNLLSLHYNHIFAVWSSTTKHVHSRVNASKSVFPPQKWMKWHGNMPMGTNLILDGAFGVCSSHLLLFISMGIDEHRKGVPLTPFSFSAPTGNQATCAGYNQEILCELLYPWKSHLSNGQTTLFYSLVSITNTDTKEQGALQDVWPTIWWLLCQFHLQQCWTNCHKKLISGKNSDFWRQYVCWRALELEARWIRFN